MQQRQTDIFDNIRHIFSICYERYANPLTEPQIERDPVHSACITAIGYDPARQCLQVEYRNGLLYRVDNVPDRTYQALMAAEDFDLYFRHRICPGHDMTRIGQVMPVPW